MGQVGHDEEKIWQSGYASGLYCALAIAVSHLNAPGKSAVERMQASWIAEDIRYALERGQDDEPSSSVKD